MRFLFPLLVVYPDKYKNPENILKNGTTWHTESLFGTVMGGKISLHRQKGGVAMV